MGDLLIFIVGVILGCIFNPEVKKILSKIKEKIK